MGISQSTPTEYQTPNEPNQGYVNDLFYYPPLNTSTHQTPNAPAQDYVQDPVNYPLVSTATDQTPSEQVQVDDEYIVIGSVNINQRSMDGARDLEIAMGGYQPHHLAKHQQPARGQIHGFRMSLWYELLGMLDNCFQHPESLDCIRKVNQVASKYWDLYLSERLDQDLPGHLLTYPVGVTEEGEITQLPGVEHFPDTKAPILGTKAEFLPPILTT